MNTQIGEQPLVGKTTGLEVRLGQPGSATRRQPLLARCRQCNAEAFFSARQVAAAHRIWKLASGEDGVAAMECLGGDGTTNRCRCGMEGEVVFTSDAESEAHWRRARMVTSA